MKITYDTTASFDIDAQKGFTPLCPDELPVKDGDTIVDELNKNAKYCKFRIGSKDIHPPTAKWITKNDHEQGAPMENPKDFKSVDLMWKSHCISGTYGAELLDGLPHPMEYNYFVYKGLEPDVHTYSPIYHDLDKTITTGVIEFAKQNGIKTFLVGGLSLDFCVGNGVIDLINNGFEVIVNLSSTKPIFDSTEYIQKLKNMGVKFINDVNDITNIEIIDLLS